jgi:hypothetical protein
MSDGDSDEDPQLPEHVTEQGTLPVTPKLLNISIIAG